MSAHVQVRRLQAVAEENLSRAIAQLRRFSIWPRSLFSRVMLILLCGLIAAHGLSFAVVFYERTQSSMSMIVQYVAKDVASAVAILERVPAGERAQWLPLLERRNYRYRLDAPGGAALSSPAARQVAASIATALGQYDLRATQPDGHANTVLVRVNLHDGTPLTVEFQLDELPLSPWIVLVLSLQLTLLVLFGWWAVHLATLPLAELARAADALGPDLKGEPLEEDGPVEVARAARAFNAMQRRIAEHLAERMQILASISHDLQTPITRMRLRADLLDEPILREKLQGDLNAMQALVQEGIAYARDGRGVTESLCRIDLHALLDSLVCDYLDAGKYVRLCGRFDLPLVTRPNALRRIIANLLDNALKFGAHAQVDVEARPDERVSIRVLDRGPGIPEAELEAVQRPFYRIENSRNRETGGTGLGLAIARQLSIALGGALVLTNRPGGGLSAQVLLPGSSIQQLLAMGRAQMPAGAAERA